MHQAAAAIDARKRSSCLFANERAGWRTKFSQWRGVGCGLRVLVRFRMIFDAATKDLSRVELQPLGERAIAECDLTAAADDINGARRFVEQLL